MSAESAVYALLSGDSTITNIVGTRIYRSVVPRLGEPYVPAIVYNTTSVEPIHASGETVKLRLADMQITCWDDDGVGLDTLADAVRLLLSRYSGTVGSVVIQEILFDGESELFDDETEKYGRVLRFEVWYEGVANG